MFQVKYTIAAHTLNAALLGAFFYSILETITASYDYRNETGKQNCVLNHTEGTLSVLETL